LFFLVADAHAAPVADRMLDVGGARLHFRSASGCGLTIVLESGGGLDASQWIPLQQQLSDTTGAAVVSYDRAGFGTSDLPKGDYGLEDQVTWLHRGLEKLHVPDDVVLVSHSYGAFLTQLYAKRYASATRAVVLIDPNTVAFIDSVGGPQNIPIEIPPDMPRKMALATARMRDSMFASLESARKAPLADSIPVTVIASGKRWLPTDEWNDKFDAARKSIVAGFPNRHLVVAEGSGHMITQEMPDLVLATVQAAVAAARHTQPDATRCARDSR
jgi:pimeloyl-ACP methyl ester carboxylesterase